MVLTARFSVKKGSLSGALNMMITNPGLSSQNTGYGPGKRVTDKGGGGRGRMWKDTQRTHPRRCSGKNIYVIS